MTRTAIDQRIFHDVQQGLSFGPDSSAEHTNPIMDQDPWEWAVADVQRFFREEAPRYLSDRPKWILPAQDSFLQILHAEGVDGTILLEHVGMAELRDDLGVKTMRERSSVLHCILKLRKQSPAYQRSQNHDLGDFSVVETSSTPPVTLTAPPPALIAHIGENVRPGEQQIEDTQGKKRRRLNPVPVNAPSVPSQPPAPAQRHTPGWFPGAALPVDELFYGSHVFGQEIGALLPLGEIMPNSILDHDGKERTLDLQNQEDSFQFYGLNKAPGEARYVYSRLQFFLHQATIDGESSRYLQRHNREAVAVFPYRDGLGVYSKDPRRSATVVQLNQTRKAVAVREEALFLQNDYTGIEPAKGEDHGEWDYLVDKYLPNHDEKELPHYGESGSEASEGSSFDRELADDDEASDISGSDGSLSRTRASDVIDMAIGDIASAWFDTKVREFEEGRAWSIWKKMKGSKREQQRLIASSESLIATLDRRLHKLKDEILMDTWRSEVGLKEQCRILEVSVEDREEQRWMIDVWQRKKEPAHVSHTGARVAHPSLPSASTIGPRVVILPQDRLSVSPTAATRIAPSSDVINDETERILPPRGSPDACPKQDDDGHDGTNGIIDDDLDDDAQSIERSNDSAASPPSRDGSIVLLQRSVVQAIEREFGDTAMCNDNSSSSEEDSDTFSNMLPSPTQFVPPSTRSVQPVKPHVGPIDLTSTSSDELSSQILPPKSLTPHSTKKVKPSSQPKRKPQAFKGNPDEADGDEVDRWVYTQLESGEVMDRSRLLIKLLRNLAREYRNRLWDFHQKLGKAKFDESLRKALIALESERAVDAEQSSRELMDVCARLFLAWHECDHSMMHKESADVHWAHIWKTVDQQLPSFLSMLVSLLFKRGSKMFVRHTQTAAAAPISIDSSEDDARSTPHKRRKKVVQTSQKARSTRQNAQERMERFQTLVETQSSTSARLEPMIVDGASHSEIMINPARAADQAPLYIHPKIASKMKNHQVDGVRFMWREITAGTAVDDTDTSQGCILAHTMGLGKTMQTIALLAAVFEASGSSDDKIRTQLPRSLSSKNLRRRHLRVLVLCPPSLLQNWRREFELWSPPHFPQVYSIEAGKSARGVLEGQVAELQHWHLHGGIMLLGYAVFRTMIQRKSGSWSKLSDDEQAMVDKTLLEGPDLVVADEAHNFKNKETGIGQSVARLRTRSRIALTGTPMSNHVGEIFAMMDWVAPGYLGDEAEFNAHYRGPIEGGQYAESDAAEIRKSIKKLAVLRHEIEPKVHRADITVLKGFLSKKVEFVITVPLTADQNESYKRFVTALLGDGKNEKASQVTMFGWLEALTLLANHPLAFRRKLLDPPKPRPQSNSESRNSNDGQAANDPGMDDQLVLASVEDDPATAVDLRVLGLSDPQVQHILEPLEESIDETLSMKTSLFVDILQHARQAGDKVLVFSMKLRMLEYLSDLMKSLQIPFGRLDGKVDMKSRTMLLENFHAPNSKLELLLISTLAGGVGLNITCANRVVIFDFGFNPSNEAQAIGRAYRLGQMKPVYVYRFVGGGTFEMDLHNKQLFKTGLAQRVIDKKVCMKSVVGYWEIEADKTTEPPAQCSAQYTRLSLRAKTCAAGGPHWMDGKGPRCARQDH